MSAPREECLRFGEGGRLCGVASAPAGAPRAGIVLVTAGLTPKSGPFRLYAQLARRLADAGLLALRFDLGGIGDSRAGRASLPAEKRAELEIRAAVEALVPRLGGAPVLLGGLCSGAEDSFRYAAADPRVAGLFLIDPFAYRTPGWRWRDALIRGARRVLSLAGMLPTAAAAGATLVDYQHMVREECLSHLEALLSREVGLHFVYTGGMRESFNHRAQFRAMFRDVDFRDLATVDYFPELRHTQVLESDRRLVVDSIARGLERQLERWRR